MERTAEGVQVDVVDPTTATGGNALPLRLDLASHIVGDFNFGQAGTGSSRLAIALLADAIGDEVAMRHFQAFKAKVLAPEEREAFELSQEDIKQIVAGLERQKGWVR